MRAALPLAILLLVAPAPAGAGDDGAEEVRTVRTRWAEGHGPDLLPGRLRVSPDPPGGVAAPPGFGSGVFARVAVPGGVLLVAADLSLDGERTWVDLDMDGDLSDEEPAAWEINTRAHLRSFLLRLPYDDEPEPVAVPFLLYRMKGWEKDHLQIHLKVHRAGEVLLGGRVRALAVVDGGGDAVFDLPERDLLLVDLDGDGTLDAGPGSPDRVEPGAPFLAGAEVWEARVAAPSGGTVEFRRRPSAAAPAAAGWPLDAVPPSGREWVPTGRSLADLIGLAITSEEEHLGGVIDDLGHDGTKPAFTALVTLASKTRPGRIRARAARALGNPAFLPFGSETVVSSLAVDADPDVATAALGSLHLSGSREREGVYLSRLDDPSGRVAGTAARFLAFLGSERARAGVLRVLSTHPSLEARLLAWEGVRTFDAPPPEEVLRGALEGGDPRLRVVVLRDLVRAGRPEAAALALRLARPPPADPDTRSALLDVLTLLDGAGPAAALVGIVEALDAAELARNREMLVRRLSAIRIPAMTAEFRALLRSKTTAVRLLGVEILAADPDPAVAEALVATAAKEDDPWVLDRIGAALASGRNAAAVALLLREARQGRFTMQRFATKTLLEMGTSVPAVRSLVEEFLTGRDEERRIRAMEAVVRDGERSLAGAVLDSLSHRSWSVRHTAARALGALRVPETVGPMIARMGEEPYLRVRIALGESLHRITGVNLYEDAALWARWWEGNREGFTMPEAPPPPAGGDTEVSRARFYGIPVRSDHVAFVVDVSGSMWRRDARGKSREVVTRMEAARNELLGAVEGMPDNAFVNVVFFETGVRAWAPSLRRLSSSTRRKLREDLERVEPSGDTNLFGGLVEAFRSQDVDTIFLLSDGEPNVGDWSRAPDILREVESLNAGRRVAIHCVSVGGSSSLLRKLAARNEGVYVER